jgi:hypothetical protein
MNRYLSFWSTSRYKKVEMHKNLLNKVTAENFPTREKMWTSMYKKPVGSETDIFRKKINTHRLKLKWWRNIIEANWHQQQAGVAILVPDKIVYKTKTGNENYHVNNSTGNIVIVNEYGPIWGIVPHFNEISTNRTKGRDNP